MGNMRREFRWMEQARPCHRKCVPMHHAGSTGRAMQALRHGRNKCVWQSCCRKSAGARDAMAKLLAACKDVIILERVAMGKACCMAIHVQPRTPTRASPSDRANGRGGHGTFRSYMYEYLHVCKIVFSHTHVHLCSPAPPLPPT